MTTPKRQEKSNYSDYFNTQTISKQKSSDKSLKLPVIRESISHLDLSNQHMPSINF